MPKLTPSQQHRNAQREMIEALFEMFHYDFQCPDHVRGQKFNPYNPAHVIWNAFDAIKATYDDLETETIADEVLGLNDDDGVTVH